MKNKKKPIIALLLIVILLICIILLICFQKNNKVVSPYTFLKQNGYTGSVETMMIDLTSEELNESSLTAFDLAVSNGYSKDKKAYLLALIKYFDCDIKSEKKSSYEMAVENGFTGTEEAWLKTLKSINDFETKTAYDLAVENGFEGSSSDWMDCLKGSYDNNKTIFDIAKTNGYKGNEAEWLIDLAIATNAYGIGNKSGYDLAVYAGYNGSFTDWLSDITKDDIKADNITTYNLAVKNGFKGTFPEWISFLLSSENGICSPLDMINSQGYEVTAKDLLELLVQNYDENKSAFNVAEANGFKGTEKEWIDIISGKDNASPYDLAVQHGYKGQENELYKDVLDKYNNKTPNSNNNINEIAKDVYLDERQSLILELTDGTKIELGEVIIEKEKPTNIFLVTFLSYDDSFISAVYVDEGESVNPPPAPQKQGFVFTKWDKPLKNIKENLTVKPQYSKTENCFISIEQKDVKQGTQSVNIAVNVDNNFGILGATLKVDYDSKALSLKSATNGDAFNNVLTLTKPKELKSGCSFTWDGIEISNDEIKNGTILILEFDIKNKATKGKHDIKVSYNEGDIVDNNLKTISPDIINGYVEIK